MSNGFKAYVSTASDFQVQLLRLFCLKTSFEVHASAVSFSRVCSGWSQSASFEGHPWCKVKLKLLTSF